MLVGVREAEVIWTDFNQDWQYLNGNNQIHCDNLRSAFTVTEQVTFAQMYSEHVFRKSLRDEICMSVTSEFSD